MGAVIGRTEIMQAAQSTFISSTYWTERIGPSAALATIHKHRREEVAKHLIYAGGRVQAGWRAAAKEAGLKVEVGGIAPLSHFTITGDDSQLAHSLFTQLMLERGFLASRAFYATFAHTDEHINQYISAVNDIFRVIAGAMARGDAIKMLKGPVAHTGFCRLT